MSLTAADVIELHKEYRALEAHYFKTGELRIALAMVTIRLQEQAAAVIAGRYAF